MKEIGPHDRYPWSREQGPPASASPPGKTTLTSMLPPVVPAGDSWLDGTHWEDIESAELKQGSELEQLDSGLDHQPLSSRPSTNRAGAVRIADAADAREFNVMIKIIVMRDGKIAKQWQAKGRWDGPLPRSYTATRSANHWRWDDAFGKEVKVNTRKDGTGGQSVEAWAGGSADRIIVHAQPIEAVTIDETAEPDNHAPGHARDKRDAGDGSKQEILPQGHNVDRGTAQQSGDTSGAAKIGGKTINASSGGDQSSDDFEPGAEDDAIADAIVAAFEHELGIDGDAAEGDGGAGGDPDGRSGVDTEVGGNGQGGENAKAGKQGIDADSRNRDGHQGLVGGEGSSDDKGGVRGAVGLFGGLISVPAALRGLVEIILIVSQGNLLGLGGGLFAKLFKSGVSRFASAVALRKAIASEARRAAVVETKAAMRRVAEAPSFKALSKEQRAQLTRVVYWELQRKYFEGFLLAARRARIEAKAALGRATSATRGDASKRLAAAEMGEKAAQAAPVAGRLPINHQYAGKEFPRELLPATYRRQGLKFRETGFPDFEPYAVRLPNGKKSVKIEYTGSRKLDYAAANKKAGLDRIPELHTWHHSEDLGEMMLVPTELHEAVKHTGGVATFKHTKGVADYAP